LRPRGSAILQTRLSEYISTYPASWHPNRAHLQIPTTSNPSCLCITTATTRCTFASPPLRPGAPLYHRGFDPPCLSVTAAQTQPTDAQPFHTHHASDPLHLHVAAALVCSFGIKCLSVDKNSSGSALNRVAELFPLSHPCFHLRTNDLVSSVKWLSNSIPDSLLRRMTECLA
jgi:hypothetical protein